MERSIRRLKSSKSPEVDGLVAELLVAVWVEVESWPLRLLQRMCQGEHPPNDWNCSETYPIFKRGAIRDTATHIPIGLSSRSNKIMTYLIMKWIVGMMEAVVVEEQAGFRSGRGTEDKISTCHKL